MKSCALLLTLMSALLWIDIGFAQTQPPAATIAPKTSPAAAATPPPGSEATASSTYGAITGRVVSEDGPLPFVSITVLPVSINNNLNRNRGNTIRTATTDAEGSFKVDGLRASAWNVIANAQGYVVEPPPDESASPFYRIGETATIRMTKGGVITGRVLNAAGEPLIAVPVSVQYVRDAQGRTASGGGNGGGFQTDDRGVYRIYGLQPGNYVVSAGRTGGGGPGGGPGGGGRPSPYDGDVPTYFPSATRDTAVEVSVSSGGETSGIDIQYRGDKGRSISGKITGAVADSNTNRGFGPGGGPGGGISVTLTHAATGSMFNRTFVMGRNGTLSYALYGVPDGEYEVTAERNSPGDNDAASTPRRVTVVGRDATGIDLVLAPLASVMAKLQLETDATKCETKRKAAFEEQLFALQPEETNANSPARPGGRRGFLNNNLLVAPERTGEMSFRNLNIGRYHLGAQLLDDNWYIRSITMPGAPVKTANTKTPAKATMVDVARNGLNLKSGDKLTGLTVKVAEGAAAIKGKVKSEEPLPPMLRVYIVPVEKERADDVLRYSFTGITTDGAFSLSHLAPGKYWLLTRVEIDDAKKKVADNTERAKLRREAEAANTVVEFQSCQRLVNYELRLKK